MSDHEDDTIIEENAHAKVVPQITTVTNIFAKFPYLKKGDYDIWAIKMQNFISSSDLLCWNIVLKGNSVKSMTTDNDDEHMGEFYHMIDAKDIWNAIKARFGDGGYTTTLSVSPGSSSSKGSSKSKCSVVDDVIYSFFVNHEIGQHLVYEDLDQMNKEEFKEYDLKQQMEMLSIKVHIFKKKQGRKIKFNGRENASNNYQKYKSKEAGKDGSDSKAMVVVDGSIDWDKQTEEGNTEPRSLENFGMVTGIESDADSEGEVVSADDAIPAGVSISAGDVAADVVSPQSETEFALMGLSTEVPILVTCPLCCDSKYKLIEKDYQGQREQLNDCVVDLKAHKNAVKILEKQIKCHQKNQLAYEEKIRVLSYKLKEKSNILEYIQKLIDQTAQEKQELMTKLDNEIANQAKWNNSGKNLYKLIDSSMSVRTKRGLGLDKFIGEGELGIDDSKFSIFHTNSDELEGQPIYNSYLHLIKDCDLHEERLAKINAKGKGILGRRPTGTPVNPNRPKPVFAGQQNPVSAVSAGEAILACNSIPLSVFAGDGILGPRPLNIQPQSTNFHSFTHNKQQIIFPITHNSLYSLYMTSGLNGKTAVKPSTGWPWTKYGMSKTKGSKLNGGSKSNCWSYAKGPLSRPKLEMTWVLRKTNFSPPFVVVVQDNSLRLEKAKDRGIVDSGCSRSMSGNKDKLEDFKYFDGGEVTFGGSTGKISGKGTIKTKTLNFENVLYVEEPLNELAPKGPLTCLIAKTLQNESTLWGFNGTIATPELYNKMELLKEKNGTLIEAARTMLAYSFLPTIFLTKAIATGCYVLNRVLMTKPYDKTPYELLNRDKPSISYLKPFGCHVTILNTSDPFGKFDKKSDEGYIVGYLIYSKAYRVYNLVSRKIEDTINLKFLENKPFVAGTGQAWMFNNDYLTDSLTYSRVSSTNLTTGSQGATPSNAGSQADDSDSDDEPCWYAFISSSISAGSTPPVSAGSTPPMSPCASPVSADRHSISAGKSHVSAGRPTGSADRPVFARRPSGSADRTPVPTGRILGKFTASASFERFPRASNVEILDIHDGLKSFDCPKSEPTIVAEALADPDWVEAMQAKMQQFRNQKVWVLVTLPDGKRAIETKGILKNKRYARGIVCINKARLVAQGHRQEERIDYTDVFAHVTRIEAIRLFLAFASLIGFMVYQMDMKSAFLYEKIAEEALRAWYERFSTFLLKHGYRRGTIDKSLFIKKDSKDIMLVQVYVDDVIFGSTRKDWCEEFETLMQSEFEMRLQVDQRPDGIFIHQEKYVADILRKFDLDNSKLASTLFEPQKIREKNVPDEPISVHLYRSMIGCLWYPRDSPFDLEAFSESDYAGANGDRKSTTGGCQFLGIRLISWQCKKQTIVLKIPTEHNVADLLTKSFDVTRFGYLVVNIVSACLVCWTNLLQGNIVHLWFLFTSAGRVTFCWLFPIPAGALVSAGHMLFLPECKRAESTTYEGSNQREVFDFTYDTTTSASQQEFSVIKEQDRLLPIANVGRIMKQILPPNAKISKEAKETMQECVSEFISFVTGEASDHCRKEKRKTVNGDDVCWAMLNLGFDDYAEPLKKYLHKIRELDGERAQQNKGASSSSNEEKDHIRNPPQETTSNYRSSGLKEKFKRRYTNLEALVCSSIG
uniref:Uncharacterized protein n=1 Tax=Tanacetum cinerariifolium TaxID=118510 RepID=A0A6L2L4Y8_TANCI|nr:hypothetical protein [Tanacetum cinerariifolium]